jgi:NADH-quinone oxidoreductase subunit N
MINEYILASPLIVMAIGAILALMTDAAIRSKSAVYYITLFTLILSGACAAYTLQFDAATITTVDKSISNNAMFFGGISAAFDIAFCLAGIMTVLSGKDYIKKGYKEYSEFYSLILLSIVGMISIAHANSLLMLFLGVELMSIVFYVLAGFFRTKISSIEAALKYFFLGAFASGFLLYGIAMIYGASGSMNLDQIANIIATKGVNNAYLAIGLGLLIMGLGFKVAAFPFHQWAPDVYTGAPTAVTGFMSTAGKAAALCAFILVGRCIISSPVTNIDNITTSITAREIIAYLSAATMLIGNLSALAQKNVKRMLAYSSVAHAGYLLMGIVANSQDGYSAVLLYSFAYVFMQVGAFAIVSALETKDEGNLMISDYKSLRVTHPALAAIMSCFMLSLAGIPPFGGFFGKYFLFVAAIKAGYLWLTIVAVIASIISMYFYIGLILNMYFKDSDNPIRAQYSSGGKLAIGLAFIGIIAIGLAPNFITNLAFFGF